MFKKLVGWPTCQVLYYVGHWTYLIIDTFDDDANKGDPSWLWSLGYDIYQNCMLASCNVNDWAGLSVWSKPKA